MGEVTCLMSSCLQDCQFCEERTWAGLRAGTPLLCSQPATIGTQQPLSITFPLNLFWLFLLLELDFGFCCILCLLAKPGRASFLRKHTNCPQPWRSVFTAPLAPWAMGLLQLLTKMAVEQSGQGMDWRARALGSNQTCTVTRWGAPKKLNNFSVPQLLQVLKQCIGSTWKPHKNTECWALPEFFIPAEFAFLTSAQVMLLLLLQGSHFEMHCDSC